MRCRLLCLALILPAALRAQGSVTGVVQDSAKRPLADAEVVVSELDRRVRTDSAGHFTIADIKAGRYELRARRLGFLPSTWDIVVRKDLPTNVVFTLDTRPQLLDTVQVTSTCPRFEIGGFLCRARNGRGGIFLNVDDIWNSGARYTVDLFRSMPGFRVDTTRNGMQPVPTTGWKCLNVLANGMRVTQANMVPTNPDAIIGLEVYAAADSIPAEYSAYAWGTMRAGRQRVSARCSLIVYWTMVIPKPLPRRVP